ncbi:MAG: alpha/beta hydrolase [Proteobacteria bacterium]|nr:alpha/beta hydrolase [Pseudomonadota bacterium]
MRIALRGLGVLAALLLVAALCGLGYRAYRQHENVQAAVIAGPRAIDEKAFVRIGGIDQWVTIRGEDSNNPVILILHGGPGSVLSPLAPVFRGWEKDFTVVQWDQRGSGKTFGRNGTNEGPMTLDRMVRDGIALSQYLLIHLHKKKLILLGHSWGTELGLMMVKRDPGLFYAYVGTGQVVAKEEKEEVLYARLMAKLKAANDNDGIAKLQAVGPPPYRSEADLDVERHLQNRFETPAEQNLQTTLAPVVLFSPDMSLTDIYAMFRGQDFAGEALYHELLGYDARKLGPRFLVPIFVFDGDHDLTTPPDLARKWFDGIEAPQKAFVILKGGGHSAILTMPEVFLAELKNNVLPVVQ